MAGLALLLLVTACGDKTSSENEATPKATVTAEPAAIPEVAGGPALVTALDIDGGSHALSKWIGKQPTVVNFWGTWCPPCQREIPDLVKLYDEYKSKGVEIVSLAIEREQDPAKAAAGVKQYAERAGMKWVMLMAAAEMVGPFKLTNSVPTTIFYDKNGNEVERFVGMRDYTAFKAAFEKAIL
jgi:thiol-disulfide isomerase/thioredoxin